MRPIISCQKLNKTYRQELNQKPIAALIDLQFAVNPAEVFGIVGPNGAGKSTTLKILMGFLRADSGELDIFGQPPDDPTVHQHIGYLPENPCLYDNLTITDHLRFAARTTGMVDSVDSRITETLELVDLTRVARQPIHRFSKGMTQRAALAYALFHQPELLVLDEPMSGLDPLGRQLVVDIIRDYNTRGNTIMFCSHILSDVERICDRIAIMNQGTIQAVTTPAELQTYAIPESRPANTSPLEAFFLEQIAADTQGGRRAVQ